ncbi:MAG: 3-oxoacyl-[acyl-carrier-protein] synthase III C-terminal domain-containing protein [Anaerolineae bacterium]
MYSNLSRVGNTSAASIPLAMIDALNEGRLHAGDHLMMIGFGGRLTWGACLVQWTYSPEDRRWSPYNRARQAVRLPWPGRGAGSRGSNGGWTSGSCVGGGRSASGGVGEGSREWVVGGDRADRGRRGRSTAEAVAGGGTPCHRACLRRRQNRFRAESCLGACEGRRADRQVHPQRRFSR